MYFFPTESDSTTLDLLIAFFTGIILPLIVSRLVEPLYDLFIKGLNNDNGFIGNFYKVYIKTLGRILFMKKRGRQKPLKNTGHEYKLYKTEQGIVCYRSKIKRLDENIFGNIEGEIERVISENTILITHFTGSIKSKEKDYLIWRESYRKEKGEVYMTTHYKILKNNLEDLPGICVEKREGLVVSSFVILSFRNFVYTSVRNLLQGKDHYQKYLQQFNINYDGIDDIQNTIVKK